MGVSELLILSCTVTFTVIGQLFLKLGANQLAGAGIKSLGELLWYILTNLNLIIGLGSYGTAAVSYIVLLSRVDISIAAPAFSLTYVLSVLLGYFVFQETIGYARVLGIVLICTGVYLIIQK
jgi:drug/metabolite transporter (DMT)-like permease